STSQTFSDPTKTKRETPMTISASTIRPGILVALGTSVVGNVRYFKTVLDQSQQEDGASLARWETERLIKDPKEQEAASKVRSRARQIITAVCARSVKWLLCPEQDAEKLDAAIKEARALVDGFNASARVTRVDLDVICGKVSPDDVEAVKAINK